MRHEDKPHRARLLRVLRGDPNPAGPGIKEEPVGAPFAGCYPAASRAYFSSQTL